MVDTNYYKKLHNLNDIIGIKLANMEKQCKICENSRQLPKIDKDISLLSEFLNLKDDRKKSLPNNYSNNQVDYPKNH